MQIDWLTVTAQITNFLILVWLLKRFLYRPVLDAMTHREQQIAARLAEASEREAQAAASSRDYEETAARLERERAGELEKARAAAREEEHRLLQSARTEIERRREEWLAGLQRELDERKSAIRSELVESAARIARAALSDLASAELERCIVETLAERIESLPAERRQPFTDPSAPVSISASFELDAAARQRLVRALGGRTEIDFRSDDTLICGLAVTGSGHSLEWNVASYVEERETRMRELVSAPPRVEPAC